MANTTQRVGIFSGTFDPVHKGHIVFALDAAEKANLDKVYFAPEVKPRRKSNVSHFAHRISMLKLATKPHAKLEVLELPDSQFSPVKTTARLKKMFPGDKLFLILGSDLIVDLPNWPEHQGMLGHMGVIAGVRAHSDTAEVLQIINSFEKPLIEFHVIQSGQPHLSSRQVRRAIEAGNAHEGLLTSVQRYISENWLYCSPSS